MITKKTRCYFALGIGVVVAAISFLCSCSDEKTSENTERVTPSAVDEGLLVGDSLKYRIASTFEGTAKVIGTAMKYEDIDTCDFVIPDSIVCDKDRYSVNYIGDEAFKGLPTVNKVVIGNCVKEIGREAFMECSKLGQVVIPNSVTNIGYGAFSCCYSLIEIDIPNSVKVLSGWAFNNCHTLFTLKLPDSITKIDEWTFEACRNLTTVTIPNSVVLISKYAFKDCTGMKTLVLGTSVNEIGFNAFANCTSLQEIVSLNPTPPIITSDAFKDVPVETCVLKVPEGSVDAYKSSDDWKIFSNIVAN